MSLLSQESCVAYLLHFLADMCLKKNCMYIGRDMKIKNWRIMTPFCIFPIDTGDKRRPLGNIARLTFQPTLKSYNLVSSKFHKYVFRLTRIWPCIYVQEGGAVDWNLLHLASPVAMRQTARKWTCLSCKVILLMTMLKGFVPTNPNPFGEGLSLFQDIQCGFWLSKTCNWVLGAHGTIEDIQSTWKKVHPPARSSSLSVAHRIITTSGMSPDIAPVWAPFESTWGQCCCRPMSRLNLVGFLFKRYFTLARAVSRGAKRGS